MDNVSMYQYLLIDEENRRQCGEVFYDGVLTDQAAQELHQLEPGVTHRSFKRQISFNPGLTIRVYSVTYREGDGPLFGFFFETAMSLTVANIIRVKEILCFTESQLSLSKVRIVSITPIGFNGKAVVLDHLTGEPVVPVVRIGNISNHMLNLLSVKPYTSVDELIEDTPNKQGFSGNNKRKAIKDLEKAGLITVFAGVPGITDKGRGAMTELPPEELVKREPKTQVSTPDKLSETAQGLLLILSDGVMRTVHQLLGEGSSRGLSNHMKSTERALSVLIQRGFVLSTEGRVWVSDTGVVRSQTCVCERLDKNTPKSLDIITPEDVKNPPIFLKKCLRQFKAIPGNMYTEWGFMEFVRLELVRLGRNLSQVQVHNTVSKFRDQLDLD